MQLPVPSVETSSSVQIDGQQHSLQVNINVDATNLQRAQSEITLTFSSTVQSAKPRKEVDNGSIIAVTTSDLCKLENDEALKAVPCASPTSATDPIDIGDIEGIEGLSDIFDGTDDFLNLKDFQFDADCSQDSHFSMHPTDLMDDSCRENLGCETIDSVAFSDGMLAPPTYTDPVYGVGANGEMVSVTTNPQGTAPVTPMVRTPLEPCPAGAAPPTPTLLGDTGPAAETLKQMAAQHQSLENAQYMGMHPGYGQDSFSSRFQQSSGCYLPGYGQRTYPIHQNIYGTGFGTQLPQQQQQQHHPGTMQGHPSGELAAMGYPSATGRTLSRYADPACLPSSLQQLENQVQSHFGAHGTPPAPQYVPIPLHLQDVHQTPAHFHLSQTQQMSVQVAGGQGQHLLMAQQQSVSVSADRRSQQNMASDRMRTQQLYQSQQQQQAFSHYGNGMHYRMPSAGAQLPSYQSVSGANRSQCASANPHHPNLAMNKTIDHPVALEHLRTDAFCGSPSGLPKQNSGYARSDQHLLSNSLASSAMPNCQPYCQPMKRDEPYTNGLLKRDQRAQNMVRLGGLSAMGQRTHSGATDWSSGMEQHRQMALPPHGGADSTIMSSCSGPMPAYVDNCGHRYGQSVGTPSQMSIGQQMVAGHMSMGRGDRSMANQGNHVWSSAVAPSMHPSSTASHGGMTLQQARQHHSMGGMMLPAQMHSESMAGLLHQHLTPASSALTVHGGHCYVTDDPHAQTVEFMRSRNSQAADCHDILPQNVIDKF